MERRLVQLRERTWRMEESRRRVALLWVPGHCGLPGNEEVGRLAGEGGRLDQSTVPVDGASRREKMRREMVCEPMGHRRLRDVYSRELREVEEAFLSRQDRVNLTRFRTGHHPSLGRWRAIWWGGPRTPPTGSARWVRRTQSTSG